MKKVFTLFLVAALFFIVVLPVAQAGVIDGRGVRQMQAAAISTSPDHNGSISRSFWRFVVDKAPMNMKKTVLDICTVVNPTGCPPEPDQPNLVLSPMATKTKTK